MYKNLFYLYIQRTHKESNIFYSIVTTVKKYSDKLEGV